MATKKIKGEGVKDVVRKTTCELLLDLENYGEGMNGKDLRDTNVIIKNHLKAIELYIDGLRAKDIRVVKAR